MLASSMMLVSISEKSPSQLDFKSRLCPSPRSNSGAGLSGWGTAETRKSCRLDLCAMAAAAAAEEEEDDADMMDASNCNKEQSRRSSMGSNTSDDTEDIDQEEEWGF